MEEVRHYCLRPVGTDEGEDNSEDRRPNDNDFRDEGNETVPKPKKPIRPEGEEIDPDLELEDDPEKDEPKDDEDDDDLDDLEEEKSESEEENW